LLSRGTIKATVLIETLPAAFEMDEILHALKEHSAGLNCGRWDYIFSFIKKHAHDKNAVMPDRGTVTMMGGQPGDATPAERLAQIEHGKLAVTVADTGCGMTAEFINRRLFRPFQTTKSKGLGIGMYQSRMIVEAQGGRIEAESQPGRGSVFRVFLPLPAVRAA